MNTENKINKNNKKTNVSFVRIPNELIRNNEGQEIGCATFGVYAALKLGSKNNLFNRKMDTLEEFLTANRRTIRMHIEKLEKLGYIKCKFEQFPKFHPMEIELTPCETSYTQVDRNTIRKMQIILQNDEQGNLIDRALRLFYILELHFNPKKGASFPTYEQISKYGTMGRSTIAQLINLLENGGLLQVRRGTIYQAGNELKHTNNNYVPNCKRIKKEIQLDIFNEYN